MNEKDWIIETIKKTKNDMVQKESKWIRIYGLSITHNFLCFCYGAKAYFISIRWTKKGLKCYKGYTTSEGVIFNQRNTYPKWWMLGFSVVDSHKGFIDYEEYIN